ncbi:MAG TPA: acyl-CoA thioesterase domain-containing protein [Streptosporangiaceae bacterium]|nr:acyl-CoA thioesterase domain-containing protein [Streptosporangiaceae bacterium]
MTIPDATGDRVWGLPDLMAVLDLEFLDERLFRSQPAGEPGHRLFGGQVAAQALVAAERTTADEARTHSLHAYFLRPGDTGRAVVFQVDPLQDGRTFSRRRVTAIQAGQPILCLEASFTTDRATTDYQVSPPAVPAPEDCPEMVWRFRATGLRPDRPFDLRAAIAPDAGPPHFSDDLWFRTRGRWADTRDGGPVSQTAILTYVSDLTFVSGILRPLGRPDVSRLTSLDHVMWFHNEPRLDDWLLFAKSTPATGTLRGLAQGSMFLRDGTLIATMAQEGLVHR